MKRILSVGFAVLLAFAMPALGFADKDAANIDTGKNTLSVSPDFLGSMLLDQNIQLMMRDGTYVEGRVFRASQDRITLRVKKAEPKDRVRGREATLSTADISVVNFRKNGTVAVPIILGVLGGFAGGVAAGYAASQVESAAAAISIGLAGIAGGASGGALLGREAAKKTMTINVNPSSHGVAGAGSGSH